MQLSRPGRRYLHLAPNLRAANQSNAEVGLVLSSGGSSGEDVRRAAPVTTERDLTDRDTPLHDDQQVFKEHRLQLAYP